MCNCGKSKPLVSIPTPTQIIEQMQKATMQEESTLNAGEIASIVICSFAIMWFIIGVLVCHRLKLYSKTVLHEHSTATPTV